MEKYFWYFRELNIWSMMLRLLLAMLVGGVIGFERERKGRAAGFRTYMLVALGAALTVILSQYLDMMLDTFMKDAYDIVGRRTDVVRLGTRVVSGVGFLGAGTIIVTGKQEVKGLTTATGLFATVCMSLAAGAGFYECVITVLLMIVLVLNIMTPMEIGFKRRLRNITLNVQMDSVEDVAAVSEAIEAQNAKIYEIDVEKVKSPASAIFILQMSRSNSSHSGMLSSVAELGCVRSVQELIS